MHPTMGSQTRRRAFGRDPSVPGRAPRAPSETRPAPRLAPRGRTQVQLALTSLIIGGTWALVTDWTPITTKGLWYGFDYKACIAAVNSAAGGLTVAAVLKYADAVLKGYATAISVLLTGVLSMVLFGTELSVEYALGMTNVLAAVFLYNAQDLEKHAW